MLATAFGPGGGRGDHVRGLRKGPLLVAVALPVLFAIFGTALVGGSGLEWYEGLENPGSWCRWGSSTWWEPSTTCCSPSSTASWCA